MIIVVANSKGGGGTWTLTGEGAFPNGTTVNMGNLIVQGNLISDVVVEPLGLLGGTGVITGNVINFGIVSPGNSPGVMTIKGNYDQRESGTSAACSCGFSFRFSPHVGHSPAQSSRQRICSGSASAIESRAQADRSSRSPTR